MTPPATSNPGFPRSGTEEEEEEASRQSPLAARRSSRRAAAAAAKEAAQKRLPQQQQQQQQPRLAVACRQCRADKKACIGGRPCSRCDFKGCLCLPSDASPPVPPPAAAPLPRAAEDDAAAAEASGSTQPSRASGGYEESGPSDVSEPASWSNLALSSVESTPTVQRRTLAEESGTSSTETTPGSQRRKRVASDDGPSRSADTLQEALLVAKTPRTQDQETVRQHLVQPPAGQFEGEFVMPNDFAVEDLEQAMAAITFQSKEDVFFYSVLARFHIAASGGRPDIERIVMLSNYNFDPKMLAFSLTDADLDLVNRNLLRPVKYRPDVAELFESDIVLVEQLSSLAHDGQVGVAPIISYASPAACQLGGFEQDDLPHSRHIVADLLSGIDFVRFLEASVRLSMRATRRAEICTFDMIVRIHSKFNRIKIIFDGREEALFKRILPTAVFNIIPATPREIALYAANLADWRMNSYAASLR